LYFIISICFNRRVTNGGKSTLSQFLHQKIHNSCIIAQDTYFKDDFVVPVDSNGFKQYDTLDALHMEEMMKEVCSWKKDPHEFLRQRGLIAKDSSTDDELYVLIVEGFLIFNHRPLNEMFDMRYFLEIPYDVCKMRRSMRVYAPPDPPNYFDGYVWPMYLQNREEMERITSEIVFLDGLKPKDEVLAAVYEDIHKEIARLQGKAAS
uniref:Nicotinamide riboside kinase 1 n=1 Tax=Poecilia latipinna TaxID=48699 RepID=A0A3B3VPY2_9TELE